MTINEYHQLLKFLYFEGYADSYEEAEYIIEEMNDEDFGALCEEVFPQYTQEDVDILDYLIYEGFADDNESALVILENMSEEWRDSIVEARRDTGLRGLKHGHGTSKSDAIEKGFRFFMGKDGKLREIRNYGSKSRPGGRVVRHENETSRRASRDARLSDVTPPEHQDHRGFARKKVQASRRNMDLHHMTPVEKSAELKASMSPEQWAQRLKDDEAKGIYHGNHPRNLALAKRQGESGPGISHHGTIHTPKRKNTPWADLSKRVKEARQRRRRRKKTKPDLGSARSGTSERGIKLRKKADEILASLKR